MVGCDLTFDPKGRNMGDFNPKITMAFPEETYIGSRPEVVKTTCPICGYDERETMTGTFVMELPPNIPGGSISVENATWEHCHRCDEDFLGHELDQEITKRCNALLGLLGPEEALLALLEPKEEKLGLEKHDG